MEGPGKLPPLSSHNNTQALISSGNMAGRCKLRHGRRL